VRGAQTRSVEQVSGVPFMAGIHIPSKEPARWEEGRGPPRNDKGLPMDTEEGGFMGGNGFKSGDGMEYSVRGAIVGVRLEDGTP